VLGRGSWIRTCFRFSLYFSDLSQFFYICRSHLRVFRTGLGTVEPRVKEALRFHLAS
jgi:hypothetical protein